MKRPRTPIPVTRAGVHAHGDWHTTPGWVLCEACAIEVHGKPYPVTRRA